MKEVIARINGFQREGHQPVIEIERKLIRCKDCKWYKRDHNGGCLCETGGGLYNSHPEDYCSRAERKEE